MNYAVSVFVINLVFEDSTRNNKEMKVYSLNLKIKYTLILIVL